MYVKITNNAFEQYSIDKLRKDNPNISFPKDIPDSILAEFNVYPYSRKGMPDYNQNTQICSEGSFEQVDGEWFLGWVVTDRLEVDVAKRVRDHRDIILQESDWVVVRAADTGNTIPTEWQIYRQALRDITTQEGFPYNVVWPTKP